MPTSLLINAKWRTQHRHSGVQRYADGLLGAIRADGMEHAIAQPDRVGTISGALWEQRTLPRIASRYDTLLCPANMAPHKLAPETRLVVIIHCLRFRFHPSSYPRRFVRWYERMIPRIIDRADRVLTVSRAQLEELERVFPHAAGKVGVLSPGLDAAFKPEQARDPGVPTECYLVCVTSPAPAKNLTTLLRAYAEDTRLPPLVLVGVDSREADVMCQAKVRSRVYALGHVSDKDRIASIVAHADAAICPSRYESFGLPCLEAMGCGTPVIASDLPAHREVCGQAAVFVPCDDDAAWGEALIGTLGDQGRLDSLRRAGLKRSKAFDWSRTARRLRAELEHSSVDASA